MMTYANVCLSNVCLNGSACLGLDLEHDFLQSYYILGVASFKSALKTIKLGLEFEFGNVKVALRALCV